ncbi:MAG: hypothetical protein AAGJ31_05915 [Verrucomicrobiota bacterium]
MTERVHFRPSESHPILQIGLVGSVPEREQSTTMIDGITIRQSNRTLPLPLTPGYPLAPILRKTHLPVALPSPTENPSALSLEILRQRYGQTPAIVHLSGSWETREPSLWPGLTAWSQSGVVPMIQLPLDHQLSEDIQQGKRREEIQHWAAMARRFRSPLLIHLVEAGPKKPLSPPAIRSAWSFIHQQFQEEKARNVLWMWTPPEMNMRAKKSYPGPDLVDLVGLPASPTKERGPRFESSYRTARHLFPKKALFLHPTPDLSPDLLIQKFPAIELWIMPSLDEDRGSAVLAHPSVSNALRQTAPPPVKAHFAKWKKPQAVIALEIPGKGPSARVRLEFWEGHPFRGGTLLRRESELDLKPGRERIVRHQYPREANSPYILVDRAADPMFLPPEETEWDWRNDPHLLLLEPLP